GIVGRLYIGGDGVARGYHRRPRLTAQRFVPDPFGRPGDRLYDTGDLVRHRGDGVLDYVGRLDHQVKLRGYRVELGEVESVLAAHPAVREAAVVARTAGPGAGGLVAYVVTGGGAGPTGQDLRGFCRERLPEHMVPGLVELL